ncbi:MAG: thioredoxin fold domain-containing protein [Gammaproteobacteria bacterium]|nr:thioredoxin fold domain-containing protein [Gammaproteobacteria bacterium]
MTPVVYLRIIFMLLMLCVLSVSASTPRDPYQHFFQQSLGDFTEELEIAREEGKKGIFVFFEMDECPFCHRMKNTVLNQSDVQDSFNQIFHSLTVDVEGDLEIVDFTGNEITQKQFASRNRVRATPVLAFYDLEGNQVVRYTGATSGSEEFMWLAEYVAEEIYRLKDDNGRKISFTRYKRAKQKQKLPN